MGKLRIWNVTFDDGGWHSSRPEYQTVACSKEEAIENVLKDKSFYRNGYYAYCSELKIDGYVIEVYDKKSYKRGKKIDDIVE